MEILETNERGRPTRVRLTDQELLVKELFELRLDRGDGPEDAMIALRGGDVPEGLRSETPLLDAILTPTFVDYLVY